MQWTVSTTDPAKTPGELLVIPVFQKNDKPELAPLLAIAQKSNHTAIKAMLKSSGFVAKAESMLPIFCADIKAGWVLLVGMGDGCDLGLDTIRRVAGCTASKARTMDKKNILVNFPTPDQIKIDDESLARCWVEGAEMALSPIDDLKTVAKGTKRVQKPENKAPGKWKLLAVPARGSNLRKGVFEAEAFAAGCLFCRHLVNLPPNYLVPDSMATKAGKMAKAEGLSCKVYKGAQLKKMNMGGIMSVGQGSVNQPCLIVLDYKAPAKKGVKVPTVCLVGKGVTFDSGGISLKPGAGMADMKGDMAGSAAVLGAALTVARLKLKVNLQVLVPAAENMPDGNAVKPADIITMANGKTVEVLNTDAEGRLILADALWFGGRTKPDYIVDIATLTGACVVALGHDFAGLMGNSAELIDCLRQAGGETFERVWHMPLIDEHKKQVEGTMSDLKNIGAGRDGGALTAAAFLSAFVDDKQAWAHIDIAGPSASGKPTPITPKGATGFGSRLLARAVQILAG